MSDQAVLLPKWSPHGRTILAKGQLDHLYTFWTMANYTTVDCLCFFDSDVNNIQFTWFKRENNPQEIFFLLLLLFKSRNCQAAVGYKFQMWTESNVGCSIGFLFYILNQVNWIWLFWTFAWANSLQKLYSSGRRVAEVVTLPHLDKRGGDGPQTKKRKMKKNRENGAKYVLKNCYIIDFVWVRLQSWASIDLV